MGNWCCLKGVFQVGVVVELDFWFLIHFVSGTIHTVNSGMTSVFIVATKLEFYPDKPETLISRDFLWPPRKVVVYCLRRFFVE